MENLITIPWGDGTEDNFYMDFSNAANDQSIVVSSDENKTGLMRTKVLSFKGAMPDGTIPEAQAVAYLKVVQQVDGLIVATFDNSYSIYDDIKSGYSK